MQKNASRWALLRNVASWGTFSAVGIAWVATGVVLAPDYPQMDVWRYIINWVLPWSEGDLRWSDPFHDQHPSIGLHLLTVANAFWFGFHQKLVEGLGLTGGVVLAAFLARRIQSGLAGWRRAAVPPLAAVICFSTAQLTLFRFPDASVTTLPILLVVVTADWMFGREWTPGRALVTSMVAATSIGLLFTDPVVMLALGVAGAGAIRAASVSPEARPATLLLAIGWPCGAALAYWLAREVGGLPPLSRAVLPPLDDPIARAPAYLLSAIGQGLASQSQRSTLFGAGAPVVATLYTTCVLASTAVAARHADRRAPFLLLALIVVILLYAVFGFVERGGARGRSGEITRYEVIRMFTSLIVLWAFLHTRFRATWARRSALLAGAVTLICVTGLRVNAALQLSEATPRFVRKTEVTARLLRCTVPDDRERIVALIRGWPPGPKGSFPLAFRLSATRDERWHYLWMDWTERFRAVHDPDWRVVVVEAGLRFLSENDLAGFDPSAESCRDRAD